MTALRELPERDKDRMLPCFLLRPWMASHHLDSALAKIEEAYGDRPYFLDLADREPEQVRRPVHDELDELRNPVNGYENWCEFVRQRPHVIPALQLEDPAQLQFQAERLHQFDRGLILKVPRVIFGRVGELSRALAGATDGGRDFCVMLDYGRQNRDLLQAQAATVGLCRTVWEALPNAHVAISASSFPDAFGNLEDQEIFERQLFDGVVNQEGANRLIYSDRGSARAERQLGGGGLPIPRIDYAQLREWEFFRAADSVDRPRAYRRQAIRLMASPSWDGALRVWGNQMIERTAAGDLDAIISPARATAVRINIHLHRQLYYRDPDGMYQTDEEWTD